LSRDDHFLSASDSISRAKQIFKKRKNGIWKEKSIAALLVWGFGLGKKVGLLKTRSIPREEELILAV
jgi:hypothetical protein